MSLSRRHLYLLKFWKSFQEIDKPSPKQFYHNHSKFYWIGIILLSIIYAVDYYFYGFNSFYTGMFFAFIAMQIGLFIRFKRDWPLSKKCIDWEVVEKYLKEHDEKTIEK